MHKLNLIFGMAISALVSASGCDTTAPAKAREDQLPIPRFQAEAAEILTNRCAVCHSCYDAPCQLKLESPAGLARGASKALVYDGTRPLQIPPTRLGLDGVSPEDWQRKGFFSVLPASDPAAGRSAGVLMTLIALKAGNPLPQGRLDEKVFDFSSGRENYCPAPGEMDDYVRRHPQWGMPFGLPGLDPQEIDALGGWIASGAVPLPPAPLAPAYLDEMAAWEALLNQDGVKARLISRYIYEHLFLATLYLEDAGTTERFRLVRSITPPGRTIVPVATRRPYDDPGAERVFYRIQRDLETPVRKRHMPYRLNGDRMRRWRELFFDAPFEVDVWPGYSPKVAANPFNAFQQLPVQARYRFLLDEARFFLDGFIKGPVCRGQIALDVINDRFWVFFMDPAFEAELHDAEFLLDHLDDLRLPSELGSNELSPLAWVRYAAREHRYLRARAERLARMPGAARPSLEQIWIGNAWQGGRALTIFRHFDSASVVDDLLGEEPKTAWLIDYPLLERIHYLLVAGYDVYGNLGHQLFSRLYMDFLRITGEMNFVRFLPPAARRSTLEYWYRDAEREIDGFIDDYLEGLDGVPGLADLGAEGSAADVLRRIGGHVGSPVDQSPAAALGPPWEPLAELPRLRGEAATLMPELTYLTVVDGPRIFVWSLLRDSAHSNVASPFREASRRVPQEDALTVVRGFVGAHPNALFRVPLAELDAFVAGVRALRSEAGYRALVDTFGVRRSDPEFWAHSDLLHAQIAALPIAERGLLDYARLENR